MATTESGLEVPMPPAPVLIPSSQGILACPEVVAPVMAFRNVDNSVFIASSVPVKATTMDGSVLPPPPVAAPGMHNIPIALADGTITYAAEAVPCKAVLKDGTDAALEPVTASAAPVVPTALGVMSAVEPAPAAQFFRGSDGDIFNAVPVPLKAVDASGHDLLPPPPSFASQQPVAVQTADGTTKYATAVPCSAVDEQGTALPPIVQAAPVKLATSCGAIPAVVKAEPGFYKTESGDITVAEAIPLIAVGSAGDELPEVPMEVLAVAAAASTPQELPVPVRTVDGKVTYATAVECKAKLRSGEELDLPTVPIGEGGILVVH